MKTRILAILGVFIALVILTGVLNTRVEDERYISPFEYAGYPEGADLGGGVLTVDDSTGLSKGDLICEIPPVHVGPGRYTLDIDHQSDYDFEAVVYDGSEETDRFILPAAETNTVFSFEGPEDIYDLRVEFLYSGKGTVTIKRTVLYAAGGLFYTDTVLFSMAAILIAVMIAAWMIRHGLSLTSDRWFCFALFAFFILINYTLYMPFPLTEGDALHHMSRIEATYNEIKRGGQIPIVLYTDMLEGRGMIGILYPYLFLLPAALLRLVHVSPEGTLRCFLVMLNIATCALSYYSIKKMTSDKYAAAIGMVLYAALPYRIFCMTFKQAYGEALAFIFIPLVILGWYEILISDRKGWAALSIGMSGLIQSHLISAIQGVCICMVIGIVFATRLIKERRILQVLYAAVWTLLLNLWYIVPFMAFFRSDIDTGRMRLGSISGRTHYLAEMLGLFRYPGPDHTGLMGLAVAALSVAAILIHIYGIDRDLSDRFSLTLLLMGAVFAFMGSKYFPWQALEKIDLIERTAGSLQFAERFFLAGQSLLLVGGVLTLAGKRGTQMSVRRRWFLLGMMAVALLQWYSVSDAFITSADPYVDRVAAWLTPGVDDLMNDDYVPKDYAPEGFPEVPSSPEAKVYSFFRDGIHSGFTYESGTDTEVDMPLTWYIGYRAASDTGEALDITKGECGNLRIRLPASEGPVGVRLDYVGYASWKAAVAVSLLAGIAFIVLIGRECVICRKER